MIEKRNNDAYLGEPDARENYPNDEDYWAHLDKVNATLKAKREEREARDERL